MKTNVTSLFRPTTNYTESSFAPTTYAVNIEIDELSYNNVEKVAEFVKQIIIKQMQMGIRNGN